MIDENIVYVKIKNGIFKCYKSEQMRKPIYYPVESKTNGYIDYNDVEKILTIEDLYQENQELKKQLENKYSKIGTLMNEVLYEENTKLINQQKEFIKYLESEIGCRELISDLLFNHNKELNVYKEVLQKYKEIIGDDKK